MDLYEITQQTLQLVEMLQDGEIDEKCYKDTLESFGTEYAIEDVIKSIRNKENEIKAFKDEITRLAEKKNSAEKVVERLKKLLVDYLEFTNQNKVKTNLFSVAKKHSESVNITDSAKIPEKYLVQQQPAVNKKQLLKDLQKGDMIDGAEIKTTDYITIR